MIAPLVLGFAAIGLFLFYFAYRYNFLFVNKNTIDEKGRGYPRALQQLFVGLYIAEICLIGLFATRLSNSKGAIGPFVLIILLVVFTALYNISLNSALQPLIDYLPKSLDAEERQSLLDARDDGESGIKNGKGTVTNAVHRAPHPKPNLLTKFLKPHVYNDYPTMRRLVPNMVSSSDDVDEGLIRDAYFSPSVWSELPVLLVPRDPNGVSVQECAHTAKVTPIRDDVAILDDKNRIIVDDDAMHEVYFSEKSQRYQTHSVLSSGLIETKAH